MKKIMLMISCSLGSLTGLHAQQRQCGTMEYLEYRKHQDPTLEQRMTDDEQRINEWTKSHPSHATAVNLPALEHYAPTGHIEVDEKNYAKAKEAYLKANGTVPPGRKEDPFKRDALREKKKQRNKFSNQ